MTDEITIPLSHYDELLEDRLFPWTVGRATRMPKTF